MLKFTNKMKAIANLLLAFLSPLTFLLLFFTSSRRKDVKSRNMLFLIVSFYAFIFLLYNIAFFPEHKPEGSTETVRIGVITCCGRKARENPTIANETLTLIKSVLTSTSIWNVTRNLEFFVFVDSQDVKGIILEKVNEYRMNLGYKVRIKLFFFNAAKNMPLEIIRRELGPTVCVYTRLFFPDSIPPDVKRILYLDTDNVVTGNIEKIWDSFVNETGSRMAGMVQHNEPYSNEYPDIFADNFAAIPYVAPKGANAGVMFMNLEEMRKFNWTRKALSVYRKYNPNGDYANDQHVINIIFNRTPDALKQFPCQFNFQHLHCDRGWYCDGALVDPDGVQIMHGAGGYFQRGSHARVYEAYRDFDLHNYQNVTELLVKPLREFYSDAKQSSFSCYGRLGKQLFKSLLV